MIRMIYKDIAVGSKTAFTPTSDDAASVSKLSDLNADLVFASFGTGGELNQFLLDGEQGVLPDDLSDTAIGLWSDALSGDDGSFTSPLTLTMTASGLFTSQGITLTFDTDVGVYATAVNIKWYNGTSLLFNVDFTPDTPVYFCEKKVENYNKVVLTFSSVNFAHCRLKLRAIDHGVIRTFAGRPLTDISVIQECSPVSDEITIDTMDFTLISDEDVNYVFQSKQPMSLYVDSDLLGVFFVKNYERTAKQIYSVSTEDYIGLLDSVQFAGGIYTSQSATALLTAIFASANVPVDISDDIQGKTITGWIPVCTCREAVRQICFAIGAAVSTARTDKARIFIPGNTPVKKFGLTDTMQGQTFNDRDVKLTELRVTVHSYSQITEAAELYKAANSGTGTGIYVEFPEPMHDLVITNGSITSSGANFAVITANSGCVLSGKKYRDMTSVISKTNPLTNVGDPANIVEVRDMTLVSAANAQTLLSALWEFYVKCGTITSELVLNGEKPGDMITLATEYLGDIDARIESERYNLYGGAIVAEVTAR